MNQINDGSAATDMMFEPYPSMLQYLSPDLLEAVQNSSLLATTNLKKKASFISMNNAKEMKGIQINMTRLCHCTYHAYYEYEIASR